MQDEFVVINDTAINLSRVLAVHHDPGNDQSSGFVVREHSPLFGKYFERLHCSTPPFPTVWVYSNRDSYTSDRRGVHFQRHEESTHDRNARTGTYKPLFSS